MKSSKTYKTNKTYNTHLKSIHKHKSPHLMKSIFTCCNPLCNKTFKNNRALSLYYFHNNKYQKLSLSMNMQYESVLDTPNANNSIPFHSIPL